MKRRRTDDSVVKPTTKKCHKTTQWSINDYYREDRFSSGQSCIVVARRKIHHMGGPERILIKFMEDSTDEVKLYKKFSLRGYRYIPQCWFWDEQEQYLTLEYVPFIVDKSQALTVKQTLPLLYQLLLILNEIHQMGWVFGDLKADNVGFTADKKYVKLFDFGLSVPSADARSFNYDIQRPTNPTLFVPPEELDTYEMYQSTYDTWGLAGVILGFLTPPLWIWKFPRTGAQRIIDVFFRDFKHKFANPMEKERWEAFINRVTIKNPRKRPDVSALLNDPLFSIDLTKRVRDKCRRELFYSHQKLQDMKMQKISSENREIYRLIVSEGLYESEPETTDSSSIESNEEDQTSDSSVVEEEATV